MKIKIWSFFSLHRRYHIWKWSTNSKCKLCFRNEEGIEMSMLGELTFFLGLQVSQSEKGIFISQTKYIKETLKKVQNGIIQTC